VAFIVAITPERYSTVRQSVSIHQDICNKDPRKRGPHHVPRLEPHLEDDIFNGRATYQTLHNNAFRVRNTILPRFRLISEESLQSTGWYRARSLLGQMSKLRELETSLFLDLPREEKTRREGRFAVAWNLMTRKALNLYTHTHLRFPPALSRLAHAETRKLVTYCQCGNT
jgi:hypothetical protein